MDRLKDRLTESASGAESKIEPISSSFELQRLRFAFEALLITLMVSAALPASGAAQMNPVPGYEGDLKGRITMQQQLKEAGQKPKTPLDGFSIEQLKYAAQAVLSLEGTKLVMREQRGVEITEI